MRLVPFESPFSEIESMFDRMMPRLYSWPRLIQSRNGDKTVSWSPSADISETDKEYLIRAELPAVKKEDVKVTMDGDAITISGERTQNKEDKNEKYHRVESFYGSFTRTFTLPEDVDSKNIKCESTDGVLTIHLPKTQVQKAKPIEIKVQ